MKQTIYILFSILRSPLLVGSAASAAFYTAVHARLINHPFVDEYFAGHPIEYVTTTLSLFGLALLLNKVLVVGQSSSLIHRNRNIMDRILSSESLATQRQGQLTIALVSEQESESGLEIADCGPIVNQLDREVASRPADKVARRVRNVLDRMVRSGSVDHLDEELRNASEVEADRVYDEYALFRVVVWAVPILGFLGTVVGITLAIANLSAEAMEQSLPLVVSSLSVAFATTIQALSLSIVLMFAKYLVNQAENRLALKVDYAVERELLGRFQSLSDTPDGQVQTVRLMVETMVNASERLVRQQAELWRESIESSEQRWAQVTATAGKQLETALVNAMSKSLKDHAEELTKNEAILSAQNHEHWDHFSEGLQETFQSATALEESVERQVLVLQKTVEATGQVARLEEALNRNLASLARVNQLEQVATSLSAAIQLLSGRLIDLPSSSVELDPIEESSSAA